ncbi:LysR family transcriptional regulator [Phyllobacterium sp. YR531]|uniref:LysR family transcriptional regulator n=1 Tax=Phyllobacterium sp. YR531 TaxID=1144343 RepID=UPI00026FB225|nr:LysR family transcriptional regulator [Phyllobacterium sp. YR531]EJN04191.1 transcriptional regulator [Phyllobacterium sp. YR531]
MDRLGALSAFMEAADAGGFTEAGRRLGLSASAVSKAVMRLEERLRTRLFHRSTRSITLTPEGRMFLERCRRIAAEMEAAELDLAQLHDTPRGKLRFSLPSAGMPFMEQLAEFQKHYPNIELDMDCSDRLVDVIDEGFDAVLRTGEGSDSRLMSRVIGTYRQVIVGSPNYLERRGIPQLPGDLSQHTCIMYRSLASGKLLDWPLSLNGVPIDLPLSPSTITNALEPQLVFAQQGVGLACLPDFTVRKEIVSGTLVQVLDHHLTGATTFRVLWPSSRHLSPKVRVFVDFVTENLLKR